MSEHLHIHALVGTPTRKPSLAHWCRDRCSGVNLFDQDGPDTSTGTNPQETT